VTAVADVLDALGVVPPPAASASPPAGLSASTEAVRALVADAAVAFDELVRRTGLDASVVSGALVELELLGLATEADGVYRGVMRPA
jgi:predicted Rossmann fold nucleotide-binding protein DprA/Smf involved in DNA uptake